MLAVSRVGLGSEHINVYPRPARGTKINDKNFPNTFLTKRGFYLIDGEFHDGKNKRKKPLIYKSFLKVNYLKL